jgi:hypothetical protein
MGDPGAFPSNVTVPIEAMASVAAANARDSPPV